MKQLKYQEIFYTSSEKGIFSGSAGFGVRTCTRGMNSADVYRILEVCANGYSVYNERVLDKNRIVDNPDILYDYPPVYLYREVELSDGAKKFVFGRTIYVGIDYGYFKGVNAYDRAGSNYLTHLLVFDQQPALSMIHELFAQAKYLPLNYSCTPGNEELKKFLVGDPEFLEEKTIVYDETSVPQVSLADCAPFIIGVVQMLKNRRSQFEEWVRLLVKCPWRKVETCLTALGVFPDELMGSLQYVTNYMEGYGLPDGCDMAFVNEFNEAELYECNYVTVNMFNGHIKNFQDNIFYWKMEELLQKGELSSVAKLIRFYLDMDNVPKEDNEFYYNVFLGAVSDLDLTLKDLPDSTIDKLPTMRLDPSQEARFWDKVNKALNDGLVSTQGSDFLMAVEKIRKIKACCPGKVHIHPEYRSYVTNILFNGRGNFGRIATDENIATLLSIVDKGLVASEDVFLVSLGESSKPKVWMECIGFYYGSDLHHSSKAVASILHSSLSQEDRSRMLEKLYPLASYADFLFDYFKSRPADAGKASTLVASIVRYYGVKRFSDFVWLGRIEPQFISIASPIIRDYYGTRIDMDVKSGTDEFFELVENVGADQISGLNLWTLLQKAVRGYLKEDISAIEGFLSRLTFMNLVYPADIDEDVAVLNCLVNKRLPKHVDRMFLDAVLRNYPSDSQYVDQVFGSWVGTVYDASALKLFIVENKGKLSDSTVSTIINAIWKCPAPAVVDKRDELVQDVVDSCDWGKKQLEDFCRNCQDDELKELLIKSNKFTAKILRKVLNIIKF